MSHVMLYPIETREMALGDAGYDDEDEDENELEAEEETEAAAPQVLSLSVPSTAVDAPLSLTIPAEEESSRGQIDIQDVVPPSEPRGAPRPQPGVRVQPASPPYPGSDLAAKPDPDGYRDPSMLSQAPGAAAPAAQILFGGDDVGFHKNVSHVGKVHGGLDLATRIAQRKSCAVASGGRKSLAAGILGVKSVKSEVSMRLVDPPDDREFQHEDEVLKLAFSPDGKTIVAGGEDSQVMLWNVETGERIFSAKMACAVLAVAYSPTGQFFAGGDIDSTTTVWRTDAGYAEVGSLCVEGEIKCMAFALRSDEMIAIGTAAKVVELLSLPAMQQIAVFRSDADVRCLSFSSTGGVLAMGGGNDDMHGLMTNKVAGAAMKTSIWSVSSQASGCRFMGSMDFEDIVHTVSFSPSGKMLAAGGEDRTVSLFLAQHGFGKATEFRCVAGVRTIAWSGDSRFLASGGEDMQITIWNVLDESIMFQLPKASDWISSIQFTLDSSRIAYCLFGSNVVKLSHLQIEEMEKNEEGRMSPKSPKGLSSLGLVNGPHAMGDTELAEGEKTPQGFSFEVTTTEGGVKSGDDLITRLHEKKSIACFMLGVSLLPVKMTHDTERETLALGHSDEVSGFAFSSDGSSLVAGGEDKDVVLWNISDSTKKFAVKMDGAVTTVGFSPSGLYFAAATSFGVDNSDPFLTVWETKTYGEAGKVELDAEASAMAMTHTPIEMLVVATTAKKVLVLAVPNVDQTIIELDFGGELVRSLSFSPDGKKLSAGGGTDDTNGLMTKKQAGTRGMKSVIWQVSQASEFKKLGEVLFTDIVHAVAFAPTGKLLAVGGENCRVTTLLVDSNFQKASDYCCTAGVKCIAWSKDSRFVASAGEDMQISIWDLVSERITVQLPKAQDWYTGLAFSPCGRWLSSCGYGMNGVTLYPIDSQEMALGDAGDDDDEEEEDNELEAPEETQAAAPVLSFSVPSTEHAIALTIPSDNEFSKGVGTVKMSAMSASNGSVAPGITVNIPGAPSADTAKISFAVPPAGQKNAGLAMPQDMGLAQSAGTCKFGPPPTSPAVTIGPEVTVGPSISIPVVQSVSIPSAPSSLAMPKDLSLAQSAGTCKFGPPPTGPGINISPPVTVDVPVAVSLSLPDKASSLAMPMDMSSMKSAGTCKFAPPQQAPTPPVISVNPAG
jgi:WD40 repeat protein